MGKCASIIEEVRFDLRDAQLTHCYVAVRAEGDCPLGVQGWHHKVFPASVSAQEIMDKHIDEHLMWSLEAPK